MPLRAIRPDRSAEDSIRRFLLPICLAAAAVAVGVGVAADAVAAEVPGTAFTQSLAAPPDFFDHPTLAFLHPQRAVGLPRQLIVCDTQVGPGAGGGIWSLGRQRVFLLSEQVSSSREYDASTQNRLRGGWASPLGRWRVGLSVSGGLFKDSAIAERLLYNESTRRYTYEYDVIERTRRSGDVLLGLGTGEGRAALDLTLEAGWEKRDDGLIRAQQTSTSTDTSVVSFEGDERPTPGFHLRARTPLSARLDCIVLADWSGHEERRPGRFQGILFDTLVDSSRVESGWRDSWRAGLGISRAIEPLDFVLLGAEYRCSRTPLFLSESYGPVREYYTDRRVRLTTSVREEVRRDLHIQLGLERSYRLMKSTAESIGSGGESYLYVKTRDDVMTNNFEWGVDWKWRNLRLTGLLSPNLSFNYLFYTLDAQLTF